MEWRRALGLFDRRSQCKAVAEYCVQSSQRKTDRHTAMAASQTNEICLTFIDKMIPSCEQI